MAHAERAGEGRLREVRPSATREAHRLGAFLIIFLRFLIIALWVLLLGRVLVSWVDPRFSGSAGRFLYQTTEPLLAPIRRVVPQVGMIDLSPLVAFLVLGALVRFVGFP